MLKKPRVAVLATGGTIAGQGASGDERTSYQCSVLPIDDVIATVPALQERASLYAEQFMQKGSENLSSADLLAIARRVEELAQSNDVEAVLVTQGTDTIEETAYFLNLTVRTTKAIVVVGAMRPPFAIGSDAQSNLYDAVCVATHPSSNGMGVLVVANSEIHSARDVVKASSFKLEAFRSPHGPLGWIVEGAPRYYRRPVRTHTGKAHWSAQTLDSLPAVTLVSAFADLSARALRAQAEGAAGVVFVGTGNGNVPDHLVPVLRELSDTGRYVVRASRTSSGVVVRNAAHPDDEYGWIVVDDQSPGKARLLLALALTMASVSGAESERARVQTLYFQY